MLFDPEQVRVWTQQGKKGALSQQTSTFVSVCTVKCFNEIINIYYASFNEVQLVFYPVFYTVYVLIALWSAWPDVIYSHLCTSATGSVSFYSQFILSCHSVEWRSIVGASVVSLVCFKMHLGLKGEKNHYTADPAPKWRCESETDLISNGLLHRLVQL